MSLSEPVIITHSTLKTFLRCPREALYKYNDLLAPRKKQSQPLERGTWFHALLEAKYKNQRRAGEGYGGDDSDDDIPSVQQVHAGLCDQYGRLMDEEKEALGDLPTEMRTLYNSYQWHYRKDSSWTVHEVELKVEAELPNGMQYQGKIDMLIEDEYGLWAVDHKTHKSLPGMDYRFRDKQSVLYIWALRECGIPVLGFKWNYVVPHAPKPLKFTKAGRLYKRQPLTDYPTTLRGLKELGLENDPQYADILDELRAIRYDPDVIQSSPVFRRDTLEKHDDMIARTVLEVQRSAERFVEYDWEDRDAVERVNERSCNWCAYRFICIAELLGNNPDRVKKQMYKPADPLAYYEEKDRKL